MPSTCISQRLNALRVSGTASSSSFVDFGEKCQDCCVEYCFEYGGGRGWRAIAKRLHWALWMGHSYLGESPRCHIVGSTTLNILQQGWDCNRFLNCASVEKDVGKLGKKVSSLQSVWKGQMQLWVILFLFLFAENVIYICRRIGQSICQNSLHTISFIKPSYILHCTVGCRSDIAFLK